MSTPADQTTRHMKAVLYSRLSRESRVSTSIEGQDIDLQAQAEREGWQIIREFVDEGKSGGKRRANADEAVRMLRDGEVDVLAAYSVDRFSRMGIGEDAELVRIVRRSPARRVVFIRENIDSASDPKGWALRFMIASEMAHDERQVMVQRRKVAIERMRRAGRNPGTGPAPFGYRSAPFDDGRPGKRFVVDHDEAQIIREVADRLVAGESCSALARELTRRKVPMPRSPYRLALLKPNFDAATAAGLPTGNWTSSRVSQLWVSDHLLGRIMHKTEHIERDENGESRSPEDRRRARFGEPILDPATGLPLQAFNPVLDVETVLAIRERFAGNLGRGVQRKRRAARLLSGLTFCGLCGSPAYVVSSQGYAYYRCASQSRGVKCAGLRVSARVLEDLVVEHYLASFGRLRAVEIIERRGAPEVDDAIATLTEQINAIGRRFADDDADVPALVQQREQLVGKRAALRETAPTTTIERVDLGQTWGELFTATEDVATRRGYIAAAYDHLDVFRAKDPERVLYYVNPGAEDYDAE